MKEGIFLEPVVTYENESTSGQKSLRILLIEPPLSYNGQDINHQVPLGFLYIAGVLEKKGFEVKILDCSLYVDLRRRVSKDIVKIGLFPEQIKKQVMSFKPDIVGINCSYSMFESDAFEVIDLIKEIDEKIRIIVGGAHVSANPSYVLRNDKIDFAVTGEAEFTVLEIAERIRNGENTDNILGTAVNVDGKVKTNLPRPFIENLDELDPAWHLIDFRKYFKHPDNSAVAIRTPTVHMVTSRGCPCKCSFCSVHTVWGRKWRTMSAKKVVDQMEYFVKKYNVRHFRLNDDNITLNKKRMKEICNEIIKRNLNIKWDTPSGVAFWTLDRGIIRAMKRSGYYRITFGIESANEEIRDYIGKGPTMEKLDEIIDESHKAGLWVASFFIIGFPYETKEQMNETISYIVKSKLNFPFIFLAQPYHGTKMYEDFKKEGLLDKGFLDASTAEKSKYKTKYFSAEELNKIRKRAYYKFYITRMLRYSNPVFFYKEFLSKIKNFEDAKYVAKVVKNLFVG